MFVPIGAPIEPLPGFHPGPTHPGLVPNLSISPNDTHRQSLAKKRPIEISATTPLDLSKSPGMRASGSPGSRADEEAPDSPGSPQSEDPRVLSSNARKQREIEAQLQFLKVKQVTVLENSAEKIKWFETVNDSLIYF